MSGTGGHKHSPEAWKKLLASMFASVVLGIGALIESILKSFFRFLESLT